MAEEVIDHEARKRADAASQAIHSHEDRCNERWGEARKSMDETRSCLRDGFDKADTSARRLHARIDKMQWAMWGCAASVIAYLASALMGLIK